MTDITLTSSQRIDVIYALCRAAENALRVAEKAPGPVTAQILTARGQRLIELASTIGGTAPKPIGVTS